MSRINDFALSDGRRDSSLLYPQDTLLAFETPGRSGIAVSNVGRKKAQEFV
jgi:hypothetical protein